MKLLSICIPTYNRALKLEKNLENLINILEKIGSWKNLIEIVVSDNHSTDNTENICKKHENNIKYYKQDENKGYDGNVLFLYKAASTKYVFFLSDDDEIFENGLRKLITVLTGKIEYDCILTNFMTKQGEKIINGFKYLENINNECFMRDLKDKLPFYFLSSFILKKVNITDNIVLKDTVAVQMNIALEILNNDSKIYIIREYLVNRIEPEIDDRSGCNIPENVWKVHMGFLRVKRKYQKKFDVKIDNEQEESIILSSVLGYFRNTLMTKKEKLKVINKIFIFFIKEYGVFRVLNFNFYVLKQILKKMKIA